MNNLARIFHTKSSFVFSHFPSNIRPRWVKARTNLFCWSSLLCINTGEISCHLLFVNIGFGLLNIVHFLPVLAYLWITFKRVLSEEESVSEARKTNQVDLLQVPEARVSLLNSSLNFVGHLLRFVQRVSGRTFKVKSGIWKLKLKERILVRVDPAPLHILGLQIYTLILKSMQISRVSERLCEFE